eukprot:922749-Amphidinium_carterae.1
MSGFHQHERQPQLFGARPLQYRSGISVATTKAPPTWTPEQAADVAFPYTLREWWRDVERWIGATEVHEDRHGPLLALSVGSSARTVADQLPLNLLKYGGTADFQDGQGPVHHSGPQMLHQALSRRFPERPEVVMIRSGLELLQFAPRRGEQMEALLLRFELLLERANTHANLQISWSFKAWILLSVLRLPTKRWMEILEKLGHAFPHDEQGYRQMEQMLIREHVLDSTLRELSHVRGFGSAGPDHAQQRYYMDEEEANSEWFSGSQQLKAREHTLSRKSSRRTKRTPPPLQAPSGSRKPLGPL